MSINPSVTAAPREGPKEKSQQSPVVGTAALGGGGRKEKDQLPARHPHIPHAPTPIPTGESLTDSVGEGESSRDLWGMGWGAGQLKEEPRPRRTTGQAGKDTPASPESPPQGWRGACTKREGRLEKTPGGFLT